MHLVHYDDDALFPLRAWWQVCSNLQLLVHLLRKPNCGLCVVSIISQCSLWWKPYGACITQGLICTAWKVTEVKTPPNHDGVPPHLPCVLSDMLEASTQQRGFVEDKALHDDLSQIVAENAQVMADSLPSGTFARIFWDSQKKPATLSEWFGADRIFSEHAHADNDSLFSGL